jgi:hypothetical protein
MTEVSTVGTGGPIFDAVAWVRNQRAPKIN